VKRNSGCDEVTMRGYLLAWRLFWGCDGVFGVFDTGSCLVGDKPKGLLMYAHVMFGRAVNTPNSGDQFLDSRGRVTSLHQHSFYFRPVAYSKCAYEDHFSSNASLLHVPEIPRKTTRKTGDFIHQPMCECISHTQISLHAYVTNATRK